MLCAFGESRGLRRRFRSSPGSWELCQIVTGGCRQGGRVFERRELGPGQAHAAHPQATTTGESAFGWEGPVRGSSFTTIASRWCRHALYRLESWGGGDEHLAHSCGQRGALKLGWQPAHGALCDWGGPGGGWRADPRLRAENWPLSCRLSPVPSRGGIPTCWPSRVW